MILTTIVLSGALGLAARGESLAAFGAPSAAAALGTPFDGRCIPSPPQRGCRVGDPGAGCVAPPSNTPGILGRRALPAGRLARLGATPDFHLDGHVVARGGGHWDAVSLLCERLNVAKSLRARG